MKIEKIQFKKLMIEIRQIKMGLIFEHLVTEGSLKNLSTRLDIVLEKMEEIELKDTQEERKGRKLTPKKWYQFLVN